MAAPNKKRVVQVEDDLDSNQNAETSSSDDDESNESLENPQAQEEIQVDFEGCNPTDSDFHGIKQLLHQLFLKAQINLLELTELIISQNYVGSVIKQSFDAIGEESGDEDDNAANDVFGVTSVINLTEKQNLECISQLRTLLLDLCKEHGSDETVNFTKSLLEDDARPVGLIINERFVNIPAQICIPLLRNLSAEIKKAAAKKMPYDFAYFILICKLHKLDHPKKQKKNKSDPQVVWSNPEEEFIETDADICFEFSVKKESDSGLSGRWRESDSELTPYRKVLIYKAEKLDNIIDKLEKIINTK